MKDKAVDPTTYVYTNILDRFNGESESSDPLSSPKSKLAEIVITPDSMTTGFLEDT